MLFNNKDILLKKCCAIIENNYADLTELIFDDNYKENMIITNHLCRICLQRKEQEAISKLRYYIIQNQLGDGGWGDGSSRSSIYGITATEMQLLFWSIHTINYKDNSERKQIEESIEKAMGFLISKINVDVFWKEEKHTNRIHGLLDLNHYIAECLYYINYFMNIGTNTTEVMLEQLYSWYCSLQAVDGGWHEIGKVRFREGTTADAIRALLPDSRNKKYIQKGVDFLLNNQNPGVGYWAGGNHDKCYDVLKAIINSLWLIDKEHKYIDCIMKGIEYILQFNLEKMDIEEKCDFLAVLIDAVNMNNDEYKFKLFF